MFKNNTKQTDTLERFRLKAHLRSYLRDPFVIDESLMQLAVERLKSLPYSSKDPSAKVALELFYAGFTQQHYDFDALTEQGTKIVKLYQPDRSDRRQVRSSKSYCHA